jgi:hypothetical protein
LVAMHSKSRGGTTTGRHALVDRAPDAYERHSGLRYSRILVGDAEQYFEATGNGPLLLLVPGLDCGCSLRYGGPASRRS